MSIANILKLLSVFLVVDYYVNGQRISELYCNDYFLLRTDPESYLPHFMEISNNGETLTRFSHGILISKDFVFTNYLTQQLGPFIIENLKVRKAYNDEHPHQDRQFFSATRYIPLNTLNDWIVEIGLLKLREAIPYHKSLSIFRPACIWTDATLPESVSYRAYKDGQHSLKPISYQIIVNDECPHRDFVRGPYICLNITGDLQEDNRSETTPLGTELETNVNNQNYLVGLLMYFGRGKAISFKMSDLISQIEPVVWPNGYKQLNTSQLNTTECGRRKVLHKAFMMFSLKTYYGEYPWHVALYRSEGSRTDSMKYICGGTIINTRTVVTAAHCVKDQLGLLPASRLTVVAGIHNLNEYTLDTQSYVVQNITVHEEYNRVFLENDIALIKLRYPITFSPYIQPICLRNNPDFNTTIGTVVGWGRKEPQQPLDTLLQADLPIRTNKECRKSNRDFFSRYLNDNNFCVGIRNGTNVCSGDSGGGMIFEHESQFYIRGIVSLGPALPRSGECDISQFVLFTDVTKFYNWITFNTDNDE